MTVKNTPHDEIRHFLLTKIEDHPKDVARLASEHFGISRQAVAQHMRSLVREGLVQVSGNTKARQYELVETSSSWTVPIHEGLEEHIVWREHLSPLLSDLPENVRTICQHGVLEMVNNVVSHSEGEKMGLGLIRSAIQIQIFVHDDGVGLFKKVQADFALDDPRHALLELSKGKLSSDPDRHTGEGIFFTSRMFDRFGIYSGTLFYGRENGGEDLLIEVEERPDIPGTLVSMDISPTAVRTIGEVFDSFASGENYDFSRTHVPIKLAKYEREQLLSRSQARRVLARFDRFAEVILDFSDVEEIGQAFADEIFRVFQREHPRHHHFPYQRFRRRRSHDFQGRGQAKLDQNPCAIKSIAARFGLDTIGTVAPASMYSPIRARTSSGSPQHTKLSTSSSDIRLPPSTHCW